MAFDRPQSPNPADPVEARELEVLESMDGAEPDSPLEIEATERGGVPVLRLYGEADVYTVTLFREQVTALLDKGPSALVIDLSGTRYIDSSGLGVLIHAARRLPGKVAVVTSQDRITRLFTATGLDSAVRIYRSLPEAVDALKS